MAKYHVNPKTGEVGECTATKRCPFGDLKSDHYPTPEAARASYESDNSTSTVAPSVKKVAVKRELPRQVFVEETRNVAAERLSTAHSVEIKGAMLPVRGVEVGYKYARVTVPDLKRGEKVVNLPKEGTVRALVRVETEESKRKRTEVQMDIWIEDGLKSYASPREKVVATLTQRVSDGHPLGASGISDLVDAEAKDKVIGDLRRQVQWVRDNEPNVALVHNRAAELLTEEYKTDVMAEATRSGSGSSNAAYNLYDRAIMAAKASFVRDGAWRLGW